MTDFIDQPVVLAGATGVPLAFDSADPPDYRTVCAGGALPARPLGGQLFLPAAGPRPHPAVIVVPGSLGVAPSHLAHAASLVGLGIAAFVIDPFGPRAVRSTVANQAQYSFAASAYDVLAAARALAARPDIDATRIGAQGHSRGGSAVLTAAIRHFARPMSGDAPPLAAVYAAYPWCGHQFRDPDVGRTAIRAIVGDQDEWCLAAQVQAAIHAIAVRGGDASVRLVAGAHHSFDRESAVEVIAEASVTPAAPVAYLANDGTFIDPYTGEPEPPDCRDRDLMVRALKAGHGRRGARIGSLSGQPALFRADMLAFWSRLLAENR